MANPIIGAVIIGRNEGKRLKQCLETVFRDIPNVVYVDSGSTDDSLAVARATGAMTVELDLSQPFTAARARNTGFKALTDRITVDYVQFIDGDCALAEGWVEAARAVLDATSDCVVVCGRRRERFPEISIYNRLCDWEWDTPVGEARACGGDALVRAAAFAKVGGFNPDLIAGEEPELCVRLRGSGGRVFRIDHEMTLHDAAMTRFGQWWTRSRRAGHAYAEGAALHGKPPERHGVAETRRALLWGAALLIVILVLMLVVSPWMALLALIYPAQVLRLALRWGAGRRQSWERAFFLTLGKFPEVQGVLEFYLRRILGRRRRLIEYK